MAASFQLARRTARSKLAATKHETPPRCPEGSHGGVGVGPSRGWSVVAEQWSRLALRNDDAVGVHQAEAAYGVQAELPLVDLARLGLGAPAHRHPVLSRQPGLLHLEFAGHGSPLCPARSPHVALRPTAPVL